MARNPCLKVRAAQCRCVHFLTKMMVKLTAKQPVLTGSLASLLKKHIALVQKAGNNKALFQKHHGCASLGFVLSCTFSSWTALICISHQAVLGQDFTAPYHQHSSGLFPTSLSIVSIDGNHILPGSVCRFHPSVLSLFSHTLCLLPPTPQLLFLVSSRKPKPWWLKLTGAQKSSCWRTGTSCKQ